MPATIPTHRVEFHSGGTRCAAWLTSPPGDGPHPAVVLVHGFGATHEMMLPQYEQHFAAAGIATLAFDYRNTGESDGEPRQHISLRAQRADVEAALGYCENAPGNRRRTGRLVGDKPWRDECAAGGRHPGRRRGRDRPMSDGPRACCRAPARRRACPAPRSVHRPRRGAGRVASAAAITSQSSGRRAVRRW